MEALDGNAIGGMLSDVFGGEMTMAPAECGGCGVRGPLAECEVFLGGRASSSAAVSATTS